MSEKGKVCFYVEYMDVEYKYEIISDNGYK